MRVHMIKPDTRRTWCGEAVASVAPMVTHLPASASCGACSSARDKARGLGQRMSTGMVAGLVLAGLALWGAVLWAILGAVWG